MDLLLVEDHPDTATVFARTLQRNGHHVEIARNCVEATKLFRQSYFDALLCDIGLPDGDGCDLLRELLRVRNVKAIAITAYGMRADMERSKAAGFVAHLTKPIETRALFRVLDDVARGAYEFPVFADDDFDFGEMTG